ncbi:TonB-dependent receptor [Pseudoalteromonas sp. NEC-BIFX-2020_002]|uniref:TonB-dependent receptor n=1 Tax=Pseudoalteromonas sp. NEC-BIFX-2020_002 TaxID=2732353 RepID=UPI00147683B7|nr:TonB-dependent receptor [Pseudoalteromonas sp. NEC-BIFX-2020_002]NNG41340.1 TonB-dependent receptor [Pseudoalteromonas sp. NEC-BIFX-2020_002]
MTLKQSACIFLCIYTIPLSATESDDLFALSFEDLLEVQVDIASKTSETLTSAPSTITVFNRQKIALLGIHNAFELMNFVPGMQSTRGDWVGAVPKDHARGVYLDSGNILVMINGERLNESSFGKASVYMPYIPVEIIDKVEFIRGPGSALYGSNAFLGVMNIVTKTHHNEMSIAIGNAGQVGATSSLNHQFNANTHVYANMAYYHKEGERYEQGVKDPLESAYLEVGINIDKLSLSGRYNFTELNKFLNLGGYSNDNQHRSENHFLSLGYDWLDSDSSSVSSKVSYTHHEIQSAGLIASANALLNANHDFFIGPDWHTTDLKINIDASHTFYNGWSLNSGVEYSHAEQLKADVRTNYFDSSRGEIIVEDPFYQGGIITVNDFAPFTDLKSSFETKSVYGQLKIPYSEQLTLFVGTRYDDVKDLDSKLSPRISVIYQPALAHTLKLQYGESFRTPVTNELYSNDDVTMGNPNLQSEYVKTTELVWRYKHLDWHLNSVLFYNQLHDFINIVPHTIHDNMFTFENQLDDINRGIELDSRVQINSDFSVEATYTHYFDVPMRPTFKRFASVIANYQYDQWMLSLNSVWRDQVQAHTTDHIFDQSAYFLIGGAVSWQLSAKTQISLKAHNLLDKHYDVYDPRVSNGAVAGVGSEYSLHYQVKF